MDDKQPSQSRLEWLDQAKGLGIVLVVAGHVLASSANTASVDIARFFYLFHMPLFFIIAGFTLKVEEIRLFGLRKAISLLVPYAIFLLLIGVPATAISCTFGSIPQFGISRCATLPFRLLASGTSVGGIFSVFWFVPCLFLALLLSQWLISAGRRLSKTVCLVGLGVMYLIGYVLPLVVPFSTAVLSLGIVPMAAIYILAGYAWRQLQHHENTKLIAAGTIVALLLSFFLPAIFDMKYGVFGLPVMGLFISLMLSRSLIGTAKFIKSDTVPVKVLSYLGKSSLILMYLHQIVHFGLRAIGLNNDVVIIVLAMVFPLIIGSPVAKLTGMISRKIHGHVYTSSAQRKTLRPLR